MESGLALMLISNMMVAVKIGFQWMAIQDSGQHPFMESKVLLPWFLQKI
jgi:hypothetical protein